MITDLAQYRATKAHLAQFEAALANLNAAPVTKLPTVRQLEIDSVQAKIDDFRAEIAEYERLSSDES